MVVGAKVCELTDDFCGLYVGILTSPLTLHVMSHKTYTVRYHYIKHYLPMSVPSEKASPSNLSNSIHTVIISSGDEANANSDNPHTGAGVRVPTAQGNRENRENGQKKQLFRENSGNLEILPKHRENTGNFVCSSCKFPDSKG